MPSVKVYIFCGLMSSFFENKLKLTRYNGRSGEAPAKREPRIHSTMLVYNEVILCNIFSELIGVVIINDKIVTKFLKSLEVFSPSHYNAVKR